DKSALAGELCLALAQTLQERNEAAVAFEVARASLRLSQRTEGLRELLLAAYRARYAGNPHLEEFLTKSGLAGGEGAPRAQVDSVDRYLTFEEGAYVFHRGGWGYGVVVEFDAAQEQMVVDFQRKRGHRIGILQGTKIIERLGNDHFGVYQTYRRDELLELIREDPARVFRIYLESHGRQAQLKNVREGLVPSVMSKTEWSRWWGRAKKALLKDPEIRVGKGSSPLLELRAQAKAVETEIGERMHARGDGLEKCAVAREYLRTLDLTPPIAEAVSKEVDAALAAEPRPGSARVALLLLKADLKLDGAAAAAEEARRIVEEARELVALLLPLDPADRKRAVQLVAEGGAEGWIDRLESVLRSGDVDAAEIAFECLREAAPDRLRPFLSHIAAAPRENPSLFLWYVRGYLQGTVPSDLVPGETREAAMEKLLTLANQVGLDQRRSGAEALKEFLRQVRGFLTARRMKLFSEHVANVPLDYARFLHAKVLRNRGLTDQTKQALLDVLETRYPAIHEAPAAAEGEETAIPEDVLYTTMRGYHKKEAELRQLREVEIPQNAEDLGRAARFGDISENAEYSAALEKQGFLMRRVSELQLDLERARIVHPEEVTAEKVVIGTRVRLRNESRAVEEMFTILGPWDVDVERGVISYLSPVGRGLLGKAAGSRAEIVLPEGSVAYTVLGVERDPEFTKPAE
ncbi:MAG: transcription elongation factor GreA, partial [Planctomycetota bacterium]